MAQKTGPQNIVTDDSFPETQLPVSQIDELALQNERNMAKFSKSKEYKALKDYMEARIDYFQKYLPNGDPLTTEKMELSGAGASVDWIISNCVIGEFKNVIQAYEQAAEAIKNADQ